MAIDRSEYEFFRAYDLSIVAFGNESISENNPTIFEEHERVSSNAKIIVNAVGNR
jgi:hypothetical protein